MMTEDMHFYIDNAPPEEVGWVLRCLKPDEALSTDAIAQMLYAEYGFRMQKDTTYSPHRLHDLGMATQLRVGGKSSYVLTDLGVKMRNVSKADPSMYPELMHFLHYSRFDGSNKTRKYLWSYRRCCDIVWTERRLLPTQEMASRILSCMREEFPKLDYGARVGARFDSSAAGRCYTWIKSLSPSPFPQGQPALQPRAGQRFELILLALDHVYRSRDYRHGDPVILDDVLLDDLARVFFLDHNCCRELITLAAKMTRIVKLIDTFAGTSVTLIAPYSTEDV